ncbi:MAG: N-acetyltransferase [Alistipes sp.]
MALTIRRATPTDLDAVCQIEQTCFTDDTFSRRELLYLIARAHGACFVAFHNGEPAGYISLLLRANTCNVRFYSLATMPAHRSCGVATALIDELLRYAAANHRTTVTLEVRCSNTPAIKLYERFGFRTTAHLPAYYHDEDGLRMTCPIPTR